MASCGKGLGPLDSPPLSGQEARSRLTFGGLCGVAVPLSRGSGLASQTDRALTDPRSSARALGSARAPLWLLLSLVPLRSHSHCHLGFSPVDVWERELGLIDITQEGLSAHHSGLGLWTSEPGDERREASGTTVNVLCGDKGNLALCLQGPGSRRFPPFPLNELVL